MKTTLEIPDPLIKRVKAWAAMDGLNLKDLVTSFERLPDESEDEPGRGF
jgi:hypothetical protein